MPTFVVTVGSHLIEYRKLEIDADDLASALEAVEEEMDEEIPCHQNLHGGDRLDTSSVYMVRYQQHDVLDD